MYCCVNNVEFRSYFSCLVMNKPTDTVDKHKVDDKQRIVERSGIKG